ncbi:hypothetical protein FNV43_RR08866 [Rhamnella rubrinervis]|uniref:Methanol O-anthraniloyltransferase-like n=1 Tax=Rhamnella rubrinervis TaxID=2594499 RepID=A0A8K0HA32_9ROSA|nr:hypothetical protein FNV43_RR08866 [Rhamnella rubrinervis]
MASPSLTFEVKRCEPELVVPAKPTPHEPKFLSDIDNQGGMRSNLTRTILFYKNNPSMKWKDPVKVIREALGRALIYYYPFAGRLKEGCDGKLVVDCNGEGVMFIEADADVTLDRLGLPVQPPFPFINEVLYNVPGSDGILGCPLLLIQVTRLLCGGFILAIRLNHTMCDAYGMCLFLNTMGEMAQGTKYPSIPPVWQRELLNARNQQQLTRKNHEYEEKLNDDQPNKNTTNMVHCSFIFNDNHITAVRKTLPPHLAMCSRFVLLTACLWRCRTLALNLDPEHDVRVTCVFNGRRKNINGLSLPLGYYGNVVAFPAAVSKAGDLCKSPLGYAVELVKKAMSTMNAEYTTTLAVADLMLIRGRPSVHSKGNYIVSDLTKVGFEEVDFGWGYPEYAGPPMSYPSNCYYIKNKNIGDDKILVPLCLPLLSIERFQQELKKMIKGSNSYETTQPVKIISKI